tara:strand:+ start:128 stop:328 length:201 start_codon:yes stop_codon:yes gene_type:complete
LNLLLKRNLKSERKLIIQHFFFLNLNQPSSLIPLLTKVIKAPKKKDHKMAKIIKVINDLSPDEALF